WQPRWFLLCGGILSYYDSQEDAWKGCKGSIQMAVCEIQEFTENTEALKTKMSELRLYCNLLVQQVHKTKEASISGVSEPESEIDMGALLKSTCDTFLKTLEECMQIANTAFTSELLHQTPPGSPNLAVLRTSKVKHSVLSSHTSTERQVELNSCENGCVKAEINHKEQAVVKSMECLNLEMYEGTGDVYVEDHVAKDLASVKDNGEDKLQAVESCGAHKLLQSETNSLSGLTLCEEERNKNDSPTFFSVMSNRFSDIELREEEGIPTEEFLESCYAIVPVLDKLGPTVFAPVKMDFVGNIKKINQKFITNKEEFDTLQKIVLHEVHEDNAYGKTLRQHHGWVVRGVFALALRAAPTYEDFVAALSVDECDPQEETFYKGMQRDLNIYLPAMEKQLNILDTLYEVHGLESDEVV
ncbi:Pleckstrin y domain-containing family A member 8, partial [Lamprotornis superbus]